MKTTFFKIHRKLARWLSIPVLLWSLSGILHPLMANWMRPQIAKTFIPPTPLKPTDTLLPPAQVFSDHPSLHQCNLIKINNTPAYRAITTDHTLIFRNAQTGSPIENAEQTYAEQLARAYLDDQSSPLMNIEKITNFNPTYSYISRYLPAYRVTLDRADSMQAVVDLTTGQLASFDNPSKRIFTTLFSYCHTWSFLGARDSTLRICVVLTLSLLTLTVALTGIGNLIFFRSKNKKGEKRKLPLRRKLHRSLGAFTSMFFLMFATSGIYHIASKFSYDDSPQWHSKQAIPTSQLTATPSEILTKTASPISAISLASIEGIPHYRLAIMSRETPGKTIYLKINDLTEIEQGEQKYAISLATEFSKYPTNSVKDTETITNFQPDYGFIQKRLPVTRVNYNDQTYWHYTVDTANAHMAQRTSASGLIEALSFINLHKWHFLDPISKELRDYATAIAALLITTITLLGLSLLRKNKPQPKF